jgi:hypothetical protein
VRRTLRDRPLKEAQLLKKEKTVTSDEMWDLPTLFINKRLASVIGNHSISKTEIQRLSKIKIILFCSVNLR